MSLVSTRRCLSHCYHYQHCQSRGSTVEAHRLDVYDDLNNNKSSSKPSQLYHVVPLIFTHAVNINVEYSLFFDE